MVARSVFLEVMRIVKFHHAGHLNSFEADEEVVYRKLRRAYKITRAADRLIYGEYDEAGYQQPPEFVPACIAVDAIREIRELLPALVAGLIEYDDVEFKVRDAYQDSCLAFDRARSRASDLAWHVICDARVLTLEPLARAVRVLRGHLLEIPLGRRDRDAFFATVVSELREIIPDRIVDLTDPSQIFDRVFDVNQVAWSWCYDHPRCDHR